MDHAVHGRDVDHEHPADQETEEQLDHAAGEESSPAAASHEGHSPAQAQQGPHDAHTAPNAHAMHAEHGAHQEHGGHADHVDHTGHEQMFRTRFWVSLVLSIPVLLYSPMLQMLLGFTMPQFPGSDWIGPLFSIVIFAYGGLPFLQMALPELRNRQPGMMTLISLAISVAFIYSLWALFIPGSETFFWELVTLIDIMLLGHWLEMRSVRQASGALTELAKLMPDTAERISPIQDGATAASFALADVIRPESKRAIERLHELDIEVAMLTGDSEAVAASVAEELGIDTYFAEVLPQHKDQKIAELQRQGKRVAMVGDGINDAPALTRADVGIAIGSGTHVAVESAGIILVKSDPLDAVNVVDLSQASYRKMIQNLAWATGYNVIALPLAAGVLAPWNIILSPAVGAALMSLSTIIVALNAQLLRRKRLEGS